MIIRPIVKTVGKIFGFASEHEKNVNVRYYIKQIRRLRKAKGFAQNVFELEDLIRAEKDSKKIAKMKDLIFKYKRLFRRID